MQHGCRTSVLLAALLAACGLPPGKSRELPADRGEAAPGPTVPDGYLANFVLPPAPASASKSARSVAPQRRTLIVLDPGHGGEDRGSPGLYGLWEADLTLDMALRVRARLAQFLPSLRVRLTRENDVSLLLEERSAMANALGAELFVSLHLNAASSVVGRGGVTSFVRGSADAHPALPAQVVREHEGSTQELLPIQDLLGALGRREQEAGSQRLAYHVHQSTLLSARRYLPSLSDRGVRQAAFHVLVHAHMPAVLLEGSFLTQPEEARMLVEPAYRDALADGIAWGIVHYLTEG